MTTLREAAKAARQHNKALEAAKERFAELWSLILVAEAEVTRLEQDSKGVEYTLWAAALGESEPETSTHN